MRDVINSIPVLYRSTVGSCMSTFKPDLHNLQPQAYLGFNPDKSNGEGLDPTD